MNNDYLSKIPFITGCSSGIGLATLKGFLGHGHQVIGHSRNMNQELEVLQYKYKDKLRLLFADFSSQDEVERMWEDYLNLKLDIDILINNAGTKGSAKSFLDISQEQLDNIIQVNLKVPFYLSQKIIPRMKEKKWGRILNISSIGTKFGGSPQTSDYCISKFGIEGLTAVLNKNYTQFNILTNTLKVGVTKTNFHKDLLGKSFCARENLIPLKRSADPREIFEMMYFLCSPQNSFTSGSTITIAGGE